MTLDRCHIVGIATPPDYLIIQWEDAIMDMQELHEERMEAQKERLAKLKDEHGEDRPIADVIDELLDTMGNIKEKSNVVKLFPNDDDDILH